MEDRLVERRTAGSADELASFWRHWSEDEEITPVEAVALAKRATLRTLLDAACARRNRAHGKVISFSRKVFIPLTRLCRDYCGYCTFRRDPGEADGRYLTPEEVDDLAEAGRKARCREALFSLGDQPERKFPFAAGELRRLGSLTTIDYLTAMSERVLGQSGLLPHSNPGIMSGAALARLRRSNLSVGLMLESTSLRLFARGQAHYNAPDKTPALRLRSMEEAGRLHIPFTTGILIGIGETIEERIDSLFSIRSLHEKYGHIQEVIVQNFRSKPGTPLAAAPEPSPEELLRTTAIARLILPSRVNLQVPPNLSYAQFPRLLDAGINDWGGISPVTRDFINPEADWPAIRLLKKRTEEKGYLLRERLAIYPEFALREEFVDKNLKGALAENMDEDGYARTSGN